MVMPIHVRLLDLAGQFRGTIAVPEEAFGNDDHMPIVLIVDDTVYVRQLFAGEEYREATSYSVNTHSSVVVHRMRLQRLEQAVDRLAVKTDAMDKALMRVEARAVPSGEVERPPGGAPPPGGA
jgi:hypothetical protein